MHRFILLAVLVAAAASTACIDAGICTTSVEPALIVEIRDSVDDTPLAAGASGRVHGGGFTDSLRAFETTATGILLSRAGADERAGVYDVEVIHPGFAAWQQSDVRVTRNACHVETVRLLARLVLQDQPEGDP